MMAGWSSKSQKGRPQLRKPEPTGASRPPMAMLSGTLDSARTSDEPSVGALPKRGDLSGGGSFCASMRRLSAATSPASSAFFDDQVALQVEEILLQFQVAHGWGPRKFARNYAHNQSMALIGITYKGLGTFQVVTIVNVDNPVVCSHCYKAFGRGSRLGPCEYPYPNPQLQIRPQGGEDRRLFLTPSLPPARAGNENCVSKTSSRISPKVCANARNS